MYPFLSELSDKANAAISCYPNAGLPNPLAATGFDLGPDDMARSLIHLRRRWPHQHRRRLLRQHTRAHRRIAKALEGKAPRALHRAVEVAA